LIGENRVLAAHDRLIFAGSPTQRKMVFYRGAGQSECRDDPHGEQDRNCRFDSIGGLPDNCAVGRSHLVGGAVRPAD
jgi:hypothetical protein